MNPIVLGVALYVLAQLALGLWVARRVQSEEDYLLAGRSLGYGLGGRHLIEIRAPFLCSVAAALLAFAVVAVREARFTRRSG